MKRRSVCLWIYIVLLADFPLYAQIDYAGLEPVAAIHSLKAIYSTSSGSDKKFALAIVRETKRKHFHELEFVSIKYLKTYYSNFDVSHTSARVRYQFSRSLVRNARFIPQIGISLELAGSSELSSNYINPTKFYRVRKYYWSFKPGVCFPARINLSQRIFIDTNLLVNLGLVDGSWMKRHNLHTPDNIYGGWSRSKMYPHDRLHAKVGLGVKF